MNRLLIALAALAVAFTSSAADKKIVFIAGKPSHGPAQHEHRAGCLLLAKCLQDAPGITTAVYSNGWPTKVVDGKTVDDNSVFDGADAIVIYSDGGAGHPALLGDHLQVLGPLMKKGVGLGCLHYAVEPTIEKGEKEFLDWIGGAFEINWSVNPHWEADFKSLPGHPVTTGVHGFKALDEWYFHMRFREGMVGVTPILTAVPSDSTMSRPDGTHSGNPAVREAVKNHEPQHMMWLATRDNGGRGFGFTGGHFHNGWGNDDQRKLVLNAILWTAKAPIPEGGVQSHLTEEYLQQNLDPKPVKKPAPPRRPVK